MEKGHIRTPSNLQVETTSIANLNVTTRVTLTHVKFSFKINPFLNASKNAGDWYLQNLLSVVLLSIHPTTHHYWYSEKTSKNIHNMYLIGRLKKK